MSEQCFWVNKTFFNDKKAAISCLLALVSQTHFVIFGAG
jgi:hypothetical protein